jgi:hypothetical protein
MVFSKKSALQMLNPQVPIFQDDLVNRGKWWLSARPRSIKSAKSGFAAASGASAFPWHHAREAPGSPPSNPQKSASATASGASAFPWHHAREAPGQILRYALAASFVAQKTAEAVFLGIAQQGKQEEG